MKRVPPDNPEWSVRVAVAQAIVTALRHRYGYNVDLFEDDPLHIGVSTGEDFVNIRVLAT